MAETTSTPGGAPQSHTMSATGAEVLTLPQGLSVSEAEFKVEGDDLVLTFPDGSKVTVEDYYSQPNPPQLASADGANLSGDMVVQLTGTPEQTNTDAIQQFAQQATGQVVGGTDGAPIGTVKTLTGEVWVTRADGTRVQLKQGDQVFQGDNIETGPDGAIGVLLADETTFSMASESQMVLDEMIYDPATQNGSLNVSVVQGVFTFVSGQVAKTDPDAMKIDTPVATIGIRGTQVGIEIPPDGEMQVILMQESDGFVGEVVIDNNSGQVVMNQGGDFIRIPSYDAQYSDRGRMSDEDIVERHAVTLRHLPVENTEGERTSGNHFGLQEEIESGAGQKDDQTQNEQPSAEQLANTETAAGGEQGKNTGDNPQPTADQLNNLQTDAGGQQGFTDDVVVVTDGQLEAQQGNTLDLGPITPPVTEQTFTENFTDVTTEVDPLIAAEQAAIATARQSASAAVTRAETAAASAQESAENSDDPRVDEAAALAQQALARAQAALAEANAATTSSAAEEAAKKANDAADEIDGYVEDIADYLQDVADAPTLTVDAAVEGSGEQGDAIPLNVSAALTDTDGSETLSVTISGIPEGATFLVDGEAVTVTDGSVTLTGEQLANLSVIPADNSGQDFQLTVTATSTETATGQTATTTATVDVDVNRDVLTSGDDVFTMDNTGTDADDAVVYAGEGDDTITGSDADDLIFGEAGNDVLIGGAGSDTLDGGEGADTADFSALDPNSPLYVDLGAGTASSADGEDTLVSIENVIGGAGDDVIIGSDGENTLVGGLGDDTLTGGAGDDVIVGGDGTDTAVFEGDFEEFTIDLDSTTGELSVAGGAADGTDTLTGVEMLQFGDMEISVADLLEAAMPDLDVDGVIPTTEDVAVALPISAELGAGVAEGTETLSVTLSGIPEGAVLSAGGVELTVENGSITFADGVVPADLAITPPADSAEDMTLTVTATSTSTATTDGVADTTQNVQTLTVTVAPDAEAPTITLTGDNTFVEDQQVPLGDVFGAVPAEAGEEVVSFTIGGIPEGATLSSGTQNEDGSWTVDAADMAGLTMTLPDDYDVDFNLSVSATSAQVDPENPSQIDYATSDPVEVPIVVTAQADAPSLEVSDATGTEDQAIALNIDAALNDASEILSVTISGVPAGATLSAGTDNGDGTWTLTAGDLDGLTVTPPANSDADFNLTVTATSREVDSDGGASTTATTTGTIAVSVAPDADAPTLVVDAASGDEDTAIPLNISSALTDTDGSETLSITISGVPAEATLSAGVKNQDGTWTLSADQLEGLTVTPPANSDADFDLTVTATTTDGTDITSVSETLTVTVNAVADAPTLEVSAATGDEDTAIALNIASGLTDQDGSEVLSVTISGVPAEATLSAGVKNPDGTWTLSADQLEGLTVTPAANDSTNFQLTVTATSTDGTDTSTVTQTLDVTVAGVADAPELDVTNASGAEDTAIPLNIDAALTDDTEVLGVSISGIPDGAVLMSGDQVITVTGGVANLTPEQLEGLTITPAADSDADFNLTVTATSTETDPDTGEQATATTTGTIAVSVDPDADAPVLVINDAVGNEDTGIPLDISATLADGGEQLSLSISGIPDGSVLTVENPGGQQVPVNIVNGVANIPAGLIGGQLTLTPPADSAEDFQLTVTATSKDGGDVATTTGTLDVTVNGVADGAVVTDTVSYGIEDVAVPITVDVAETDIDGSETLTVTLSNIPDGAVILRNGEAVTPNADGTVTLGEGELDGLSVLPPANFSGSFDITVSAQTNDEGDLSDVATGSITVDVAGAADGAALNLSAAAGDEDTAIALPIAIDKTDASETAEITLSGIPDGAVLSNANGPISVVDGVAMLSEADLAGLQITPPANSDVDFNLGVSVVTTDGQSTSAPATGIISVGVDGIADVPTLEVGSAAAGTEDGGPIALDISSALTDTDGSETLSVTISGVPAGATLSAGTDNGDGTWTLSPADLDGLTVTPGADSGQDFTLTVTATSTEADGGTATNTATIDVSVEARADAPDVTASSLGGQEDGGPIPLNIDANAAAQDVQGEVISLSISGVPEGAVLSSGVDNGDGTWSVTPDELEGLSITLPEDFDENFSLSVTATAEETDPDTGEFSYATSAPVTFEVAVGAVADAPTVMAEAASGAEDGAIPLTIDADAAAEDLAGEVVSLTISGVPAGASLSAGTDNGDGTWTLTPAQLDGLTITPPEDSGADFTLQVTATAEETDPESGAVTTATSDPVALPVSVAAVADAPDLTVGAVSGAEDTAIPLNISAGLNDLDGSETLSITITGVPAGAVLSAGTYDPDSNTWTLSGDQLDGLTVTPPEDSDADFQLGVVATATDTDPNTGAITTATSRGTIEVTVDGAADGATLTLQPVAGDEDTAIALPIAIDKADESETAEITLSGIPEGATLSNANGPIAVVDGIAVLTEADLAGLQITPPADSGADFQLGVSVTTTDGDSVSAPTTGTINVGVDAVADVPSLSVASASGAEDTAIPLNISAGLADTDGSEVLSVTISDVPSGAVLTLADGSTFTATEENSTFLFAGDQLSGLTITPPANSDEDFTLKVTATTIDTDPNTLEETVASVDGTLAVSVDPEADAPTLVLDNAAGNEDTAIPLNIDAGLTDDSELLSVTISGVPQGATLSAGTYDAASDTWTLSADDLDGLTVTPAANSDADMQLTVTATSTEADGSTASTTSTLGVSVTGVADAPTLSVSLGEGTLTQTPGNGGSYVGDGSDLQNQFVDNGGNTHTAGGGDDVWVVNRDLQMNENFIMGGGNDTLIINGDVPGGVNINLGGHNDSLTINGDILGNVSVNGAGQTNGDGDVLYLGKGSDHYQFQNFTNNNGMINTQIIDLDTGQTITVNNIEAIGFGDGTHVGNGDLVEFQTPDAGEAVVTYPLDITSSLTDTDGSETLSITVSGLPEGAVLSAGTDNGDGTWTLAANQLDDLTLTVPSTAESFNLAVTATATENDGDTASVSASVGVSVDDYAETPDLNVSDAAGTEDQPIPLNIAAALTDLDGSESLSVTLSGIPDGAVLKSGDTELTVENGAITFADGVIPDNLTIQAPADSSDDFALTVTATSTESSTGDTNTVSSTLNVAVAGDADAPTLSVNLGEGTLTGGTEDVPGSVTVQNVGQASAGYNNTYGYYVMGEDGTPQMGEIVWPNVKTTVGQSFTIEGVDPESIGFFVIPNGASLNNGLQPGMDVTFTQGQNGQWYVTGPNGQNLSGQGDPVLFSDPALNENQHDYTQDSNSPGNQNWEDLVGGGDNDYNDVNINVSTTPSQPGTGPSVVEYPLDINAALTDTDGSETLSATLSGLPAGAVVTLADGTEIAVDGPAQGVTLNSDQLQGITLTVPADATDFDLAVTATATEAEGDTASVSTSVGVELPDPTADAPELAVSDAAGNEDTAIALDIAAALTDTDGSEILSISVSGVPAGALLSAGTDNGDGTWTLSPEDLDGLTITPAANSSDDFQLTVSATSTETDGGDTATTSATIDVSVAGIADAPTLSAEDAEGEAGTALPLDISAGLQDLDGSESLSVTISGIPEGATLSAGTVNPDGSVTLTGAQLEGLSITLPETQAGGDGEPQTLYSQNFNDLWDGATAIDNANGFSSTGGTGSEYRTGVDNDRFEFQNPTGGDISTWQSSPIDISGQENVAFSFNLKGYGDMETGGSAGDYFKVIAVVDGVEHELMTHNGELDDWSTITLDNIPVGDTLLIRMEVKTTADDEVYKMDNLSVTASPAAAEPLESFQLQVEATATEADGDTATVSSTLDVTVTHSDDDASAPVLQVTNAAGAEDTAIPLDVTASLTDLDGSEDITAITISGVPAGAVLNNGTYDAATDTWTLQPADLVDLTVTPAANSADDFQITVSVTSTESNGGATATTSATIDVDVTGVADAPTLSVEDAEGEAGTTLPLDISAGLQDLDGSESLSVTISGIPEGATLSAGTVNPDGSVTLTGAQLEGLSITLPETAAGEGGGEPQTLYSQNFNDLQEGATSAGGDNGFSTDASNADTGNYHEVDNDRYEFSKTDYSDDGQDDYMTWNSAPIDISGQEDVTFSFKLGAYGDMESSGSHADFFRVIAVVDGVEHELMTEAGDVCSQTFTLDNIPEGDELIIRMEVKTTSTDEVYKMDDLQVVGTPAAAEPLESFQLQVEATATEADGDTATVSSTLDVNVVNIDDEASAPTLTVTPAAATDEDTSVALDVAAALTDLDGSEALSISISGIPDGAVLKSGDQVIQVTDGIADLTPDQLDGLNITPPADSSDDFQLTVTATSTEAEGGATATTSATIDVNMAGVADAPTLSVEDAEGAAGTTLPLDISAGLQDLDGSESLSVTISGIPEGATLSAGTVNDDGSVTLTGDQLEGLSITLPETAAGEGGGDPQTLYSQNFNDTFDGQTAAWGDNGFSSTGGSWGDDDRTAADDDRFEFQDPTGGDISTFTTAAIDISGQDNVTFSFDMKGYGDLDSYGSHADYVKVIAVVDGVEHELMNHNGDIEDWTTFTLDNIPEGDELVIKLEVKTTGGDEKYKMDNLSVTSTPAAAEPLESFQLHVEATATEADGDTATVSTDLNVEINSDDEASAPTLTVSPASAVEDTAVALNIAAALTDTDGSETLAVTISGIPDGAVLKSGDQVIEVTDGVADLTPDQLDGLNITPPANSDGDFQLTVSATSTEVNGGATTTTTAVINVDVAADADVPTITSVSVGEPVLVEPAGGEEVTIDSSNVLSGDGGFTVAARTVNSDGSLSDASSDNIGFNSYPAGFGVSGGNASGDSDELGFNSTHGVSEELIVAFDDDVSSADVAFSWMHSGEHAKYELYKDGVKVGEGVVTGVTDGVDAPVSIATTDGSAFDAIVFTAPGGEDDFLINSITYETAGSSETVAEYPINVAASLNDVDGSESLAVTIGGIPEGATLSAGTDNGDGTWTVAGDQLGGLKLSVPVAEDLPAFDLTFAATATEASGGDTATSAVLTVEAAGVNLPEPEPAGEVMVDATIGEGEPIVDGGQLLGVAYDLNIDASVGGNANVPDLTITVSGIPAGATLTAGTDNGNGSFTLTPAQLSGLQVVASSAVTGDFALSVSANSGGQDSATDMVTAELDPSLFLEYGEEDFNNDSAVGSDTSKDDWTGDWQAQTFAGSTKNDELNSGGGGDTLYGGAGNDEIEGSWGSDTFYGGSGNDELQSGDQNDIVYGGSGNDEIDGGTGNDTLFGGSGSDEIFGDHNEDLIYGGSGNDEINAGTGHDTVYGGAGNDDILGDHGDDTIYGGTGNDEINAGTGNDYVHGGSGDDEIIGDHGDDTLLGGSGDDEIEGGTGNDVLFGGLGDDFLEGGDGNDVLFGGAGNDILNGGSGNNTFIFDADSGHDIIEDIMMQDTLEFDGEQFDMNDMIFRENEDGDVQIAFQGNDDVSVTLKDVKFADLNTNGDGSVSESYSVTQTDDGFKVQVDEH